MNAGILTLAGAPVPEHCLVTGKLGSRTGSDGQTYAIGFEMRMPQAWSGRFYYQGNGGLDGSVVTATGATGGGPTTNALLKGFAVISSDAGHTGAQTAAFGFEAQARLDYGYQAAAKLTPMAKALVKAAYGRAPDRSYFGGCSNGGRHTLVATSRLAEEYDGCLAGAPGYNLPKAAVSQIWGAQQYARAYTAGATTTANGSTIADLATALTPTERTMVAGRILAKCDALDSAADGIVSNTAACQKAFSLADDVPTCSGARDGTCLTALQKDVLANIHAGARTSTGSAIYNTFPFDAGITATSVAYAVSGMDFMTPPNPANLSVLKNRGAKVMVYHGVSDAVFSYDDLVAWLTNLANANANANANGGDASHFARLFGVPGMNHCSGGPATDQFDMLAPLVQWVEQGKAPDSVIAAARGTGNVGGVNAEVPASGSATRTRPLCPYPKVARYTGSGSLETAASVSCH